MKVIFLYTHTPPMILLSLLHMTCSLYTKKPCGKREAKKRSSVIPEKAAPVTGTTLRTPGRPCAGGLSTVDAISTQLLCDLINSGLTRWRLTV